MAKLIAEKLATEEGVTVEYIRKMKTFRKEDRIQQIIAERGDHLGLVHISRPGAVFVVRARHDKTTGRNLEVRA